MDEPHAPPPAGTGHILQSRQRLSHSLLWQLQRRYFAQAGLEAWRSGTVPHYVTSNPFIARAYAHLVLGWLRDMAPLLDRHAPLYIVELGAGPGRLAYHFLQQFFALLAQSSLHDLPVCYVMTDYSQRTVAGWQSHPQLQPWVAAGRLDFALFDGEQDDSLTLLHGGVTLAPGTLANPLALLANYFFDGLMHDAFFIEDGQLFESLVTLTTPRPGADSTDPALLPDIACTYVHEPASSDYYDDPAFNQILAGYQQGLLLTHLLFPIGGLHCLRSLARLSGGRLLLLAGDKGYHHAEALLLREEPGYDVHGSFSLTVNFHALGAYVRQLGGLFLSTPQRPVQLDVCAFLLGPAGQAYPETRLAYQQAIVQGGPDDFFVLKQGLEKQYAALDLAQLLAYLRLSGWDHKILLGCFPALLEKLDQADEQLRLALHEMVQQVWQGYLYLGEVSDVPFCLGLVLSGLGYHAEAAAFLQRSLLQHGPDAATFYNLALCYQALGQDGEAVAMVTQALALQPDLAPAGALHAQLVARRPPG